jgi:hypothetical protein
VGTVAQLIHSIEVAYQPDGNPVEVVKGGFVTP